MADTRLTGLLRHLHAAPGPVPAPADREALAAFVATRDESAFAALVHRHGPMVLNVCRRVLGHQQDAEDAYQATFLVLARRAATVGRAEALASWLHGVAVRTALRARRDAGRRRAREQQARPEPRPDPAEALAWRDVQTLLETEIRRLPERFRAPFVLCHLEGRGRAEAATELRISENTLSSRLARARDRLRDRLALRGVHLSAVLAAAALSADPIASAVSPEFVSITVRAGLQYAARQPVAGVAGHVLELSRGAMTTMTVAQFKWVVGTFAVGGLLAVGTWVAGQPGAGPTPTSPHSTAERPDDKPAKLPDAGFAERQKSMNNLKAIMLAMHSYHDANGRFPDDVRDKKGRALLSWRVELLPYLEHQELYRQFKRDEAWDSPHNLKLLSKMPDVFRTAIDPKDATHTYYQRFAFTGLTWGIVIDGSGSGPGPGGPGGGGAPAPGGAPPGAASPAGPGAVPAAPPSNVPRFPLRMAEVTDGTSNTIGIVEAGPPVPWSKPADFHYDAKKPLPHMVGPYANARFVGFLDGSAQALKPNLDETTWRRLIEPNDNQPLPDRKDLHAHFPADSAEEKKALARLIEDNQALIATIEKLSTENAQLLRKHAELTRDVDQAEATQEWLKQKLEELRAINRKYRADLGLRPDQELPKKGK